MYCHACGMHIMPGSVFCSSCGAAQGRADAARPQSGIPSVVIALLLVLLPPVGLILMWASSGWSANVKWGISGIFFPPLWLYFLWRISWVPYMTAAAITAFTALAFIQGEMGGVGAGVILIVTALILFLTLSARTPKKPPAAPTQGLRQAIEAKLDGCNELIAGLEASIALDLLPPNSPTRHQYTLALEMRSQGFDLFKRAVSPHELALADDRVTRALHELHSIRDGITGTGP